MKPATALLVGPDPAPAAAAAVAGAGDAGAGDAGGVGGDLAALGCPVTGVDTPRRLAAAVADAPAGPLVLVDRRFVGHRHALRLVIADSRFAARFAPGALAVSAAARPSLHAVLARPGGADWPDLAALRDALRHGGVPVREVPLGELVAGVAGDPAARAALTVRTAAVDEETVRLRAAVKSRDGFLATFAVSPYSRHLARACARAGLTPNQVTVVSLLLAFGAAGLCATGTRVGYVLAAVVFWVSFVLDCVDGQLARYTLTYSPLGAWLDATFDRVKEYVVYAGLALGAARAGDHVWHLAAAAMVVQTVRHLVDFAYTEAAAPGEAALNPPDTGAAATAPVGASARLSDRLDAVGWTVWARRTVVLPIAERWALIALITALSTPRLVFTVLLVASGLAAGYTTTGRVLRSLPRTGALPPSAARALTALTDTGLIGQFLGPRLARLRVRFARRAGEPGGSFPPGPQSSQAAQSSQAPQAPQASQSALGVAVLAVAPLAAALAGLASFGPAALVPAALWYVLLGSLAVGGGLRGRLDWLVPPLLRAAEYGTVLIVAATAGAGGAMTGAFGFLAVIVYHHYDTVYRLRGDVQPPPAWIVAATGGHEGRVLAMALACALPRGLAVVLPVLAGGMALAVLTESIRFWARSADGAATLEQTGEVLA